MNDELQNVIEGAGGGGGCFRAGTQIQLEGGRTVAIETLKVGDEVLAFDERGNVHRAKVTKTHYHEPQPLMRVKFWRGEVCLTPNHWVLNQYNSFVEIGTMTTHDALVDGMGHLRPITGVERIPDEPVYNLTVEPHHTFIADGVCVHNGGHRARYPEIAGAGGGGGGKSGGGGSARAAVEANDSLQSKATIGIIDLIGEGEIGGLVDGAKSIFLNDTPLQNVDGSYNFSDVTWTIRNGTQYQDVIYGAAFDAIATPRSVSVQIKYNRPHTVSVENPQATECMIVMTVPQLMSQDKTTGDISGSSVSYRIEMAVDGGAFTSVGDFTISGKTRSRYQRGHTFSLPTGTQRIIRVTRLTADSTTAALANELWFDSYVERVNTLLTYPNTALVGVRVDATQFSSIPSRSYLVDGLFIRVPTNYNPIARTYSGVWNGTFKLAVSNNPAWILYDLLTAERYGLGDYIESSQVDKSTLYQIGRYCDELVSNGMGGYEPRFTLNTVINTLQDAYKLVAQISSVFRGMGFWMGSSVSFTHDAPRDPSMIYNQSNVIDGVFSYVGSARKDRHSVALITWNDPNENYKQKIEYVEDAELVGKFGVRKTDMVAFGCTSRAQAHRLGRWILYTEKYESQLISFKVGTDSALVMPGDVIKIHDDHRAGKRLGGRVKQATLTSATLDAQVTLSADSGTLFLVRLPNGKFEERSVEQGAGTHDVLTWNTPLTELPLNGAIFIVSEPNLVPMIARVVAVGQGDTPGTFAISALEHNPSKYDAIEKGYQLEELPTSVINPRAATAPTNIVIAEEQYEVFPGTIGTRLAVSWSGDTPSYEVSYRRLTGDDPSWTTISTTYSSIEIENARKGTYEVRITGINAFGVKSATELLGIYSVLGKTYAPGDVVGFKVQKRITDLLLTWAAVTDVDVRGYEIRIGSSWDSGEVLTTMFMGTSFIHDHSEKGTYYYHIRSIDSAGNYSENTTTYALVLDAPAPVEQFNCVQSGGRLEFRWRPNPEADVTGYEVREGTAWGLSAKIAEITGTSLSIPAGSAAHRTFWIKAIASPGIYSDVAMLTVSDVAQSADVNLIYTDDQWSADFPGSRHRLSLSGDNLQMDAGSQHSEYIFETNLPASYRGQNTIYGKAESVVADTLTWANANFAWSASAALRPWEQGGSSPNSISVRYQIAPHVGLQPDEIDAWEFNNSLASMRGTATVAESVKPIYQQGRYKKGIYVSDVSRVSWNVAIPNVFSKTFWFNPTGDHDAIYLTISADSGSKFLKLSYSQRDQKFRLSGSDAVTLEVAHTITPGNSICVGIGQSATSRRLMIGEMGSDMVGTDEKPGAPIANFTKLALY